MNNKLMKSLAWIFTILGSVTIFVFMFNAPFNDGSGVVDPTLFGVYGDFIGGFVGALFSLAGFSYFI